VGNYKPKILGTDKGIYRRFRIIPLEYEIPLEQRLPQWQVMEAFRQEREGILAWLVRGCIDYCEQGLPTGGTVEQATADFKEEQDVVGCFLEQRCGTGEEMKVLKTLLYQEWREWCEANGEFEHLRRSQRWLVQQLIKKGYDHFGEGRGFLKGLGLKG
jgi:putative DNA primase/helicase